MSSLLIDMKAVEEAKSIVSKVAKKTPLSLAMGKSLRDQDVHLKFENFQVTGSFKIRGAMNKISALTDEEKSKGVIAASAGNHAQGVAKSAQIMGVESHIVMPMTAPLIKVSATKSYGAHVHLYGRYFDEAFQKAKELEQEKGFVFVHPYQDPKVIAGQATIGSEIFEDLPDIKSVVVPIGGGGLISGIAYVLKTLKPDIKVYGVVSEEAPGMANLKHNKKPKEVEMITTIADGIAVKNPSKEMFDNYISKYVDDIVTVSDEEMAQAIVYCMENEKAIVEGSGAAGLAAVLNGKLPLQGPSCVLLCGGNIDLNTVNSVIDTGLRKQGRLSRISTIVGDLPGALANLTKEFAMARANVLDVIHDRVSPELNVRETRIDFLLETMSLEHIEEIKNRLRGRGVRIVTEQLAED